MSVLIDNALNLARLDSGRWNIKRRPTQLLNLVEELLNEYKDFLASEGFEVKLKIEVDLPEIEIDPEAIELVLRNLVDNSVKYSLNEKVIEVDVFKHDNKLRLQVSDRGEDIPARKRKAIFRKYYRIKRKDRESVSGSGVGLSLVKGIVRAHKGKVWCEGRKQRGSRFIVELPV